LEARALIGLTMLIAYILLGLAIAFYSRRFLKPCEVDFYIASHRLGGLVAALT
jgi:Na+/proline symporter